MILTLCLFTLLGVTHGAIKGGPRIVSEPAIQEPHIHVGKGGGGGGAALHHTAVVTDPVSLNPVVVEKVTPIATGGGIKGLGGIGSLGGLGGFSAGDAQISSLGGRRLYRVGASNVPYGLSGLDYYSYPASLLSNRRVLGRKGIVTDNLSGLSPIGRRTAIIADPTTSQFSVGDAQIRLGGRGLYRTGISSVPFGLSGLDYYSYPRNLLTGGSLLGSGLGQTKILSGGGFGAGDAQVSTLVADPIGQERVIVESSPAIAQQAIVQASQEPEQITTIVEDGGFGQRQVTTVSRPVGGLRGGNIILRGGPAIGLRRVKSRPIVQAPAFAAPAQVLVDSVSGLGAPIGGYGQRQVVAKTLAPAPVIQAPVFSAPAPIVQTQVVAAPAPIVQAPVFRRRLGEAFLTQAARPLVAARRVATIARPVAFSQPAVAVAPPFPGNLGNIQFTLGNTQIIGGPALAPAPVAIQSAPVFSRPIVEAPRQVVVSAPRQVVVSAPRQVVVSAPRQVVAVQQPVVSVKQPAISQVKTSGYGRRIFGRQIPQMVYVDGGSRFAGIDLIGGYRIGDPRRNYATLPISTSRFANLGLSQGSIDAGPILVAPAPSPVFGAKTAIGGANTLGLAAVGKTSPAKIVTQEEVIGPAGDSQIVTTVSDAGPSKIGGLATGGPLGLSGVGQTKTITQEEVIGPAGDSQVITTVRSSGPSKIGGLASGGSLGLSGVGQTKTITQEEVIGPAGDSQVITTVRNSGPSKIGGLATGGSLGLVGVGNTSPAKIVTQEEVIGPAGDSQIVTTVTDGGSSKIGGLATGGPLGLTGIGQTGVTKTVTQEEVVGPAGDTQVVTTVTETASGPSKIGGLSTGGPLGLTAVGQAPSQVITQEEVVGPAGDTQVVTTIQETSQPNIVHQEDISGASLTASPLSQIIQDPIETAISQETLGDSGLISTGGSGLFSTGGSGLISTGGSSLLSPLSQSSIDPIGQSAIEVSQGPIVQESISSGFGGGLSGGYAPRVSFLSQHPYDIPSRALLRQAITSPIVQEQQQLEQILVK